jgi:O-succinylbenzoic acid--CoA ligase
MFQLKFQNQTFSSVAAFKDRPSNLPDFVKSAFEFCSDWLEGKEFFEQKTSGSTGTPKIIRLERSQMIASALATKGFFGTGENTKIGCCLNPEYIAGKMMLVRAMVWKSEIELVAASSNPLLEISETPDFLAMVPLQVEQSLSDPRSLEQLQKVQNLIIGGAPLSGNLKALIVKSGIQAFQTYGMTETVSHIALAKITADQLTYRTLPGVEIGVDERQALWIRSQMSGTLQIQTNDQVKLISENTFQWLGRVDFVINSGGVKIHPELLEAKASGILEDYFPNSQFFFAGIKDEKFGEKLILVIEGVQPSDTSAEDLKEKLKSVLNQFENPKELFFVNHFIRTPSGKLDRNKTVQRL